MLKSHDQALGSPIFKMEKLEPERLLCQDHIVSLAYWSLSTQSIVYPPDPERQQGMALTCGWGSADMGSMCASYIFCSLGH